MYHSAHIDVRGQLGQYLLPPFLGFRELNLGHQACLIRHQAPLPDELSHHPQALLF